MDQAYDNLFVGDVNDADNPKKHRQNNIRYILNLSGTTTESDTAPSYDTVKEQNYIHIPIADDGSNSDFMIKTAIETAKKLHEKATEEEASLLIHCSVGSSRSVAITASIMSLENGKRVWENVNRIKRVRPIANPHDDLIAQVNRITSDIYNQ